MYYDQEVAPISEDVRSQRQTTCMFNHVVAESVEPGRKKNPLNVKIVEEILTEEIFNKAFPNARTAYTYTNFLKALAPFTSICKTELHCKQELATMFAHFQQDTNNIEMGNKGLRYCKTWLHWSVNNYPCIPNKKYYGRGSTRHA